MAAEPHERPRRAPRPDDATENRAAPDILRRTGVPSRRPSSTRSPPPAWNGSALRAGSEPRSSIGMQPTRRPCWSSATRCWRTSPNRRRHDSSWRASSLTSSSNSPATASSSARRRSCPGSTRPAIHTTGRRPSAHSTGPGLTGCAASSEGAAHSLRASSAASEQRSSAGAPLQRPWRGGRRGGVLLVGQAPRVPPEGSSAQSNARSWLCPCSRRETRIRVRMRSLHSLAGAFRSARPGAV
jgi:hypothetical protein